MLKVKVYDYSNFSAGRSANGGNYGFWETYEQAPFKKDGEPAFFVSYHTTSDFDYCEYCGRFGNCGCYKETEIITYSELKDILLRTQDNQSEEIYYETFGKIEDADWTKIRRRIEDALRKTASETQLFNIANILNVNIW